MQRACTYGARDLDNFGTKMTTTIWGSIAVGVLAAFSAYVCRFLTLPAAIAAAFLGVVILGFGGWDWAAVTAGSFLITALLSDRHEWLESHASRFEKVPRNSNQVLANGLLIALIAVWYRFGDGNQIIVAAYLGCVGAVAGDTWASSAAQFQRGEPRLLASKLRVPHGTPGAVTQTGFTLSALAGFVASMLYLLAATVVSGDTPPAIQAAMLSVAAVTGALAGSLFDSYLGANYQAMYEDAEGRLVDNPTAGDGTSNRYVRGWRWLDNDLVNSSNSIAGATAALIVWLFAGWLGIV